MIFTLQHRHASSVVIDGVYLNVRDETSHHLQLWRLLFLLYCDSPGYYHSAICHFEKHEHPKFVHSFPHLSSHQINSQFDFKIN